MRIIVSRLARCATAAALVASFGAGPAPGEATVAVSLPSTTAALTTTVSPSVQLAHLTMQQRIGQIFMVSASATGASAATPSEISANHVGNVYLSGRSATGTTTTAGVVRAMTSKVSPSSTGSVKLLVGTDQEGGYVQVLSGPGFSTIPTALSQGTQAPATLQANSLAWGRQLAAAGLNLNLAPVLDTVPSAAFAPSNAPIGYYEREYGYAPQTVSSHGLAFNNGMAQAGLVTAAKHFPGLGRVTANTDVTGNVHDMLTTINDAYLQPFQAAVNAGIGMVMISSAYYDKIDPNHIGPFSATIMETMLRRNIGFNGVIISDDLCNAVQLAPWSLATRATSFFNAGGTMLLCANPASIPAMYGAVFNLAKASPSFAAVINAAALKVLQLKAATIPSAFGNGATNYLTDFNGDGLGDVLARDAAGILWLYPGNGAGGWLPKVRVGGGWNIYNAMFTPGDFNGNGTSDILARDAAGKLWFYDGNGRGGFATRVQVGNGWGVFTALLSPGDFNGDGRADVLARDAAGILWLYPGNGAGGWLPKVRVGGGWNIYNAMFTPGDFNGNGTSDILARDTAGKLWFYDGDGRGGFATRVQVGNGWGVFTALLSPGDFNGDGRADVLARDAVGGLWLYPGNGAGGWLPKAQVGNGWNPLTAVF
ncbi:beta-glucosidase-like glycosyl hydrolase [Arthrobacter sp. UYCu511]|uniref:glycoside hydrolase family 3 N-terminal domain-containing protein n=1 Tax=Arthrobacter sp. UYCu511 TaxID=3156337 RepID=UPI0033922FD1